MSYRAAAQFAGIAPETLCRWVARGEKAESGLFHEFFESVQAAQAHFALALFQNIERNATEVTKITRQTVQYEGGEIVNGQLKDGKVAYAMIVTEFRPPKWKSSKWLLERRFPEKWGPQAKGDAHERLAIDNPLSTYRIMGVCAKWGRTGLVVKLPKTWLDGKPNSPSNAKRRSSRTFEQG